jgi:hypothetical protein
MKGRAAFNADTLTFKADTAASACQISDARYVISRTTTAAHRGVGMDGCGGRGRPVGPGRKAELASST